MTEPRHTLLICTVGGTAEPIVAAIRHWKPARVHFVHSTDTGSTVDTVSKDAALSAGLWEALELGDPQDFGDCVRLMRRLDEEVSSWRRRGDAYDVVVDFTGGTKCMSAALSLVSRPWVCAFSYVGGTERTKGGSGIVVSGKEQTLVTQNPWNALGYQAVEDACLLFDRHAFASAAGLLAGSGKAADDAAIRRRLGTLRQLCEGYDLWDRFEHTRAIASIKDVFKNSADLEGMIGPQRSEAVIRLLRRHSQTLEGLSVRPASPVMVADLLANARRRGDEARYDDGVARLYRAIEWLAQLALGERHGISNTGELQLEQVPLPLRTRWASRAEGGMLHLGLQDAYLLLGELGDPMGRLFQELRLNDPHRSPLMARNKSILAHGFDPVGTKVFENLLSAAMKLGNFAEADLPTFPKLAASGR